MTEQHLPRIVALCGLGAEHMPTPFRLPARFAHTVEFSVKCFQTELILYSEWKGSVRDIFIEMTERPIVRPLRKSWSHVGLRYLQIRGHSKLAAALQYSPEDPGEGTSLIRIKRRRKRA